MSDKTELTREEVEALLAGATPGPWQVLEDGRSRVTLMHVETAEGCPAGIGLPVTSIPRKREPDADLIAAAPTLARQLLATMDELAEARAALAAERGEAEGAPSEGWNVHQRYTGKTDRSIPRSFYWWKAHPLRRGGDRFRVYRCRTGRGWVLTTTLGGGAYPTAREAMRAADAALTTMEPPDAD